MNNLVFFYLLIFSQVTLAGTCPYFDSESYSGCKVISKDSWGIAELITPKRLNVFESYTSYGRMYHFEIYHGKLKQYMPELTSYELLYDMKLNANYEPRSHFYWESKSKKNYLIYKTSCEDEAVKFNFTRARRLSPDSNLKSENEYFEHDTYGNLSALSDWSYEMRVNAERNLELEIRYVDGSKQVLVCEQGVLKR